MSFTPEQLDTAIDRGIEKYVNGHIRGLATQVGTIGEELGDLKTDFKKHVDIVQPIIQQFNDQKGFMKTIKRYSGIIGSFAGILIGGGIIVTWMVNHFNFIPK